MTFGPFNNFFRNPVGTRPVQQAVPMPVGSPPSTLMKDLLTARGVPAVYDAATGLYRLPSGATLTEYQIVYMTPREVAEVVSREREFAVAAMVDKTREAVDARRFHNELMNTPNPPSSPLSRCPRCHGRGCFASGMVRSNIGTETPRGCLRCGPVFLVMRSTDGRGKNIDVSPDPCIHEACNCPKHAPTINPDEKPVFSPPPAARTPAADDWVYAGDGLALGQVRALIREHSPGVYEVGIRRGSGATFRSVLYVRLGKLTREAGDVKTTADGWIGVEHDRAKNTWAPMPGRRR